VPLLTKWEAPAGSVASARLQADRRQCATRLVELTAKLDGLDEAAGLDLVGVRQQIEAATERLARLDARLDAATPPHRLKFTASKMLLPASAVEELADARRTLKVLVRALVNLPAGCIGATALLNAGIAEQLVRITKSKGELDRYLEQGGHR
jgi:hypothetical protein